MQLTTVNTDTLRIRAIDNPQGFPLLVERAPSAAEASAAGPRVLVELWSNERAWLDRELHSYGAVLFRGFQVATQELFQDVMAQLNSRLLPYVDGNSPRTRLGRDVYTSTEYPAEYFISLHNELSYSARWPARLFFCCITAPEDGGETPLADGRALLRALPSDIVSEFRRRGVRYIRNLHGGRGFGPSWQKTFETTDREVLESYAADAGLDLTWLPDGSARLTNTRPATTHHPLTGEEVWFNQADQFHPSTHPEATYTAMMALYKGREDQLPQNATFGDGTGIPVEMLDSIRVTTRGLLSLFRWRPGDLLMVDNLLASHGRMPFRGARRILVSMTAE